jgi:hypothetical protein
MPPGPTTYLLRVGAAVRAVPQRLPGALAVTGTARLAAAARVARYTTTLTIHAGPYDSTAWVFEVPGGRLTLVLSPGPYRGFSGEGGLLTLLADPAAEQAGVRLLGALAWAPSIDPGVLARATGLLPTEVTAGLAWLAASGRVGYDLTERTYFHRDLPVDAAQVLRRSPRLTAAHRLVERGAVTREHGDWIVQGTHARYQVVDDRCGCDWWAEHRGSRGPCKHVLAVALVRAQH